MKKGLVLFVLCICLLACSTNKAPLNSSAEGLQGRWELTLFTPGGKEFAELFGQRRPNWSSILRKKEYRVLPGVTNFLVTIQLAALPFSLAPI